MPLALSKPFDLLAMPWEIFEIIISHLSKVDAFELAKTCKALMQHPVILERIYTESIEVDELSDLIQKCQFNRETVRGPSVTWRIDEFTGPLVRRLAMPDSTGRKEIRHLIQCCRNLHSVDFTQIMEPIDRTSYVSNEPCRSSSEQFHWPPILRSCPELFCNLREVKLLYGQWDCNGRHSEDMVVSNQLPLLLSLATHLTSLELTFEQGTYFEPADARPKLSEALSLEIWHASSKHLSTLGLYRRKCTIGNLHTLFQTLEALPKLQTIKLNPAPGPKRTRDAI